MRFNKTAKSALVLCVLWMTNCLSTRPGDTAIPEEAVRVDYLYGYEIQTPFTGKRYIFAYGDLRVEGTVTRHLNPAVQGISSKKTVPFRGNAEYAVDMAIGDDGLSGKIKVELDCIKVDLDLNGTNLAGEIDFGASKNYFALVVGNKTLLGDYTYTLRISDRQLVTSDYSFDVIQGVLQLDGQITYKNDTYMYTLLLNGKVLNGTSSFGGSKNVYSLYAPGLTTEELALFFLVNVLKTIHFDMRSYHSPGPKRPEIPRS